VWLVLGQDGDVEASWIADGLGARADRPVRLVTASGLVHDCRWEHRVGAAGTSSRLVLGDGTVLDAGSIDGVVNRLCWLGAEGYVGASERDREYATGELFALGLSWLESLGGRVVNRPTGSGLAGSWRRAPEWRSLARAAGLAVVPYESDEPEVAIDDADRVVLVLDGEVVEGPAPAAGSAAVPPLTPADRDALAALAGAAGQDLLDARLVAGPGPGRRPALRTASFLPPMSLFGDVGLDALHKALTTRSGVDR
jgi:hypothetical protein